MRPGLLGALVLVVAGCGPVTPVGQRARSSMTATPIPGQGARPPSAPRDGTVPELLGVWYQVVAGDTINGIAGRHGVPPEDLLELNGVSDPRWLAVGQELFVYGVDEIIRRHAAPARRPKAGGAKGKARKKRGKGARPSKGRAGSRAIVAWPIKTGRITSGFGPRWGRVHKGLDVGAPIGTAVLAAASGKVIYSNDKQRGYGNLVIIQHSDTLITVYAHNKRNLVDEGQSVRQGAKIAELGNTGRSTGPHLHFEVRIKGSAVDPLKHLPKKRPR